MKKLVSLVLCLIFCFSAFTVLASSGSVAVKFYDPALDGKKFPMEVPSGSVGGQRICITEPAVAMAFCMPTWSRTDCTASIGVFKWVGDVTLSMKGGAIYEKHFDTLRDCATNRLDFDEPLPAGEYFFAIYNTTGQVGVWRYPRTLSEGYTYLGSSESENDLELTLYFAEKKDSYVSPCKSIYDVDGNMPVYEEIIPSEDHPTVALDVMSDTWVITDGLGREVAASKEDTVREDKYVGLFYWSWHNDLASGEPFNINNFILENPDAKNDYKHPLWPTGGTAYFWNEPIYGYYRTTDRWVLRKHAELLADAGIDVIFFDNTNGAYTWASSYSVIFEVFQEAYEDGVDVPKISFLLPFGATTGSLEQLRNIYVDIFRPGKYRDLWFYWEDKPLLMAHPNNLTSSALDKEISEFFTFRPGQPEYANHNGEIAKWGWLSIYPQDIYFATNKDKKRNNPEQISVGVAQNSSPDVLCTAMNGKNIRGRSYTNKDGFAHYEEENSSLYGYNFAEQWEYAIEVDPTFVFVTGWNEWTAGRQENWGGVRNAFADQFNDEYSRDIEPTKGALKDHYYNQLIYYVRQFKGTRALEAAKGQSTVDISLGKAGFGSEASVYRAYADNVSDRSSKGYGSTFYTDESGRNDITGARLTRDGEYLYILIECANEVIYAEDNWMVVYLDTAQNGLDGWESFDYVINKTPAKDGKVTVERFTGTGYATETVGEGEYCIVDNSVAIKVKRADIGIAEGDFTVNFKVTDGVVLEDDIMNFYTTGDVAPGGRFKYSYYTVNEADYEGTETEAPAASESETSAGEDDKQGDNTTVIIIAAVAAAVVIGAVIVIIVLKKKK